MHPALPPEWTQWGSHWHLRPGTIYLNHGSFGPPPEPVREARLAWIRRLDEQPMDFFVRELEPAWHAARSKLAEFVGSPRSDLIFVENATVGMNVVADSLPLAAGDEVLLTDHEYGAVQRIWQRACQKAEATLKIVELPLPFRTAEETTTSIMNAATDRTRLIVVSHVTSVTAVILPVQAICAAARSRGIPVCIDGPHAPAQVPLSIREIGCDYYTASCHKWLSAPFGSGFLYVSPPHQGRIRPSVLSWGRLLPGPIESWSDEFIWSGTRDPSAFLAIPTAIEFLENTVGAGNFRRGSHALAQYARYKLVGQVSNLSQKGTGQVENLSYEPLAGDDPAWYGSMAHVPLPPGDKYELQNQLWQRFRIEVPIVEFRGHRSIRVSCHLYNTPEQIDALAGELAELL
ncbi:MAG TPA: aminotransferase class V-fold PLP-dependent enzyme [Pirellulaceae bacterium]|nr:aminotransferase class V-fold PLP-dependent enzyme [Pirellulaceae bacterium]